MTIIQYYQSSVWRNILSTLIFACLFCCLIIAARLFIFNNQMYLFLVWNLFLAGLPLLFACCLRYFYFSSSKKYISKGLLFSLWLLFFPNAPYIITDLVHLGKVGPAPMWFDASIIFCAALTGLMMGIISLYFIHELILQKINKTASWLSIGALIVLSSYGIYLGRVLRWNSWDLFTNTTGLIKSSIASIFLPSAMAMTIVFSGILILLYYLFYSLIAKDNFLGEVKGKLY